jgi:hypothetical protein
VQRHPMPPNPDLLRGDLKILRDLATLSLVLDARRIPARKRLERQLGVELARRLRSSLADIDAKAA